MGIQSKILTRQKTASVTKIVEGVETSATIASGVGTLALGKPGDIVTRAYGPVVRALVNDTGAAMAFGAYNSSKGILVNSNDCVGVGTKFDTVYTLAKGEVGSFLVSGACIVKKSQLSDITAASTGMNVQGIFEKGEFDSTQWTEVVAYAATATYTKGAYVSHDSNYYKALKDLAAGTTPTGSTDTNWQKLGSADSYSDTAAYAADSVVTYGGNTYANPEAIDDVVEIEVNGFKADKV